MRPLDSVQLALAGVAFAVMKATVERWRERKVETRLDAVGSQLKERKKVVDEAISTYTERLSLDIAGLRSRASWSFFPGLFLCALSISGPWLAYEVFKSTGKWESIVFGSAIAAVLLGSGSALLRHDNKIREQIQASQYELLYFRRLKAGLECALNISEAEYGARLKAVIGMLIAAPPQLAVRMPPPEPEESQPVMPSSTVEMVKTAVELVKPAEKRQG